MNLSIVVPCLNEATTLPIILPKCFHSLKKHNLIGEVIVADNGSTDNSVEVAKSFGARVINVPIKGYGSALSAGFNEAQYNYILMGDADDSYDFSNIDDFISKAKNGDNFIIGTRLKGHIQPGAMPFLHRYLGTPILTFLINFLYKTNISDCNCGLRLFKKSVLEKVNTTSTGMEYASEMLILTAKAKIKITEIPIAFYKDKRNRKPHLNTWRDGVRHLKTIIANY